MSACGSNEGASLVPSTAMRRLSRRARSCRRCGSVAPGSAVLGHRNGPTPAPLLFVAEAPGYRGGVRYGVPLWGDQTGINFRAYCAQAGVDLRQAFLTNAVLCHPPGREGGNRTPLTSEVRNCNSFLREIVELVAPLLVVTLGRVALLAAAGIAPHGLRFGEDVAVAEPWLGRDLMALYHPSGQTLGRRSRLQQEEDYRSVARWLSRRVVAAPPAPV